jgi:hypothetical protein
MELNKTIEGAKTVQRVARFSAFSLATAGVFFDPTAALAMAFAGGGLGLTIDHFLPVPEVPQRLWGAAYVQQARDAIGTATN